MKGHELVVIEWVASVRGSGFVGTCACGWETPFHRERGTAIAEAADHTRPPAPRPATRRLRFTRRPAPACT